MEHVGEAERVIESMGCGCFQVMVVLMLYILCGLPAFFSSMFMVFGNYNPGWRCLDKGYDNDTTLSASPSPFNFNHTISINATDAGSNDSYSSLDPPSTTSQYSLGTCQAFASCARVEFNPESSTVVTEWSLLCNHSWVLSLIICVQMAGMLVGASVAGQIQDTFGRKRTLYTCLALNAIIHVISSFSTTWELFAALQFLTSCIVTALQTCYFVHLNELLTKRWRGPVFGIPSFNMGGVVFALTCMALKDWRHVQLAATAVCVVAIIPVIWVPESLRWLEVKNKNSQFIQVTNKIARANKKEPPLIENMNFVVDRKTDSVGKIKRHTLLDLFHKGYRLYTVTVGVEWFLVSCIFFTIYFGIGSLYGHFYINMLLMDLIELPFCFFRMAAPNFLGRKWTTITYFSACTLCLYTNAVLFLCSSGTARTVGTVVFALIAKISINAVLELLYMYTPEIYPTVVRGLSLGWGSSLARFGGLVSAFLIPSDPDTYYINYIAMASMGLMCCLVTLGLPETRGRPLKETFDDDVTTGARCQGVGGVSVGDEKDDGGGGEEDILNGVL